MKLSMRIAYGDWFAAVERLAGPFAGLFPRLLAGTIPAALLMIGPALAQTPAGTPVKMVVLGDSLSAGYELPAPAAFPIRLQKALKDKGIEVDMINAGVSGDTTSAGLARLDWSVPE